MSWNSALFAPGRMSEKNRLFLDESRRAHDRITNLLILTHPLLVGAWQFRETAKHFASLASPSAVKNAVLSFVQFPRHESAIRRLDFTESIINITWERQKDATAEMMFLVACSIFENFNSEVQDTVFASCGISSNGKAIEKGLQFPTYTFDLLQTPPAQIPSPYRENLTDALTYFPLSTFISSKLCPHFPARKFRNILEDLELKLHTYLLFKKFRNTISHGRFDNSISKQYDIVDQVVTSDSQGQPTKVTLSRDASGNFYVSHYDVIGFIMLLLSMVRDIDFIYLISESGERDVVSRLSSHRDSRQMSTSDSVKELKRLKSTLAGVGVPDFPVDEPTRAFFIKQRAWRP